MLKPRQIVANLRKMYFNRRFKRLKPWKSTKFFDDLAAERDLLIQKERLETLLAGFTKQHKLGFSLKLESKPWRLVLSINTCSGRALSFGQQDAIRALSASLAIPGSNLFVQESGDNTQAKQLIFNLHINNAQCYISPYPKK